MAAGVVGHTAGFAGHALRLISVAGLFAGVAGGGEGPSSARASSVGGPGVGPAAPASGGGAEAIAAFEPAPVLSAGDLLPAALLKGPKHAVEPTVRGDGFLTAYTVTSEFGAWEAVDREMLEIRVAEVYSLDELAEVSKTEVFARAFAKAAEKKATAVARVVKDPVGTAESVPGAVARFAKGIGRSARKAYDKVTADGEGPDDRTSGEKAGDAASAAGGAAESILISGKRREWAKKVGADPYTTNEPLADKLDEVGWTAYAGGFALAVAAPGVPGLGTVTTADRLVYELPPGELEKRNVDKLKAAGVSAEAVRKLVLNDSFTATLQTELTEALAALSGASGKTEMVALAAEARSEGDARYIRRCVQLLAAGAKEVGGWKALTVSPNDIEAVAADGRLVLPWSADYMTWNEGTVPEETAPVKAAVHKEVWISGVATERAKQQLATRGFTVRERRPLE